MKIFNVQYGRYETQVRADRYLKIGSTVYFYKGLVCVKTIYNVHEVWEDKNNK